jgi:hypothetical protein
MATCPARARDAEGNQGRLRGEHRRVIVETFKKNSIRCSIPAVLVASHGPFTWGRDVDEAVHNAVVLEFIARLAGETLAHQSQNQSRCNRCCSTNIFCANTDPNAQLRTKIIKPQIEYEKNHAIRHVVIGWTWRGLFCRLCLHAKPTNISRNHQPSSLRQNPDGTPVEIYTLRNDKGMEARIMTYGGIVVSLKVPDKNGKFGDVVLGYDNLDGYVKNSPYLAR